MRLTILNQFYSPDLSPTAQLATSLGEHRAAAGDEVRVVASRGGYVKGATDGHGLGASVRVSRIWTPRLGKGSVARRLLDYGCFFAGATLRMLTLPRQDVIVVMTTPPFIALTALAHKVLHPSTRLVIWCMDCYPEVLERSGSLREQGLAARMMRALNRLLFRYSDHLVVLDEAMGNLLRCRYVRSGRKFSISVVPNWERAERFPLEPAPAAWEGIERLGLRDRYVVLYSGNAGVAHEFETTLAAARALQGEPVSFLFVGAGRRHQELAAAARELPNLVFCDYVPAADLRPLMASVDCSLISLRENFLGVVSPSKLHANLAMSLPILYVGPIGGNVDAAIADHGCGVSLRNGDGDGMVAFIRSLLADRQLARELGRCARQAFETAYCDRCGLAAFDLLLEDRPLDDQALPELRGVESKTEASQGAAESGKLPGGR